MREMVLGITQQGWLGGGGQKVQGGGHQGRIHWEEESQHSLMEFREPGLQKSGEGGAARTEVWRPEPTRPVRGLARAWSG